MNGKYFFDSGLPRSGTTLLSAILNQNPDLHTGPMSPVFGSMMALEDHLRYSEEANIYQKPDSFHSMVSGLIGNYYKDVNKPYIIDKCRAWSGQIARIKHYITDNPKIIVTVRNPLDILSSFITLIEKNKNQISFIDRYLIQQKKELTTENRCDFLMGRDSGVIYQSIFGLMDGLKEYRECIHLIEYEDLINDPDNTISNIYNFLEIEYFEHDFNNIVKKYSENDNLYRLSGMHEIRTKLEKKSKPYEEVLSEEVISKYKNLELWKQ